MSHDSMHTVQCVQDTGYYVLRSGRARVTRALLEVTQYVQVFLLKQNFYHRRETAVDLFAQLARHETLERDGTMKAGVARRNKSART